MKILLISASPHKQKSSTFQLAKEVLRGAAGRDIETETIHLSDYRIGSCRGCDQCHRKNMDCPIKDDAPLLGRKILEADGIILASPNYINQVTGSMKTLFDRLTHFIHCKRLLGKYICGVISSGGGRDKQVLDYLKYYANVCGAQYSGGVSSRAPADKDKLKEALAAGKKLAGDIKKCAEYPGQQKVIRAGINYFSGIVLMHSKDWEDEYSYWKDKGWL
jgi:multimeric flavodoxin WrbA